jgi:hypothetical protein
VAPLSSDDLPLERNIRRERDLHLEDDPVLNDAYFLAEADDEI